MADRITKANLEARAKTINEYFKRRNVHVEINITSRNGKKCIDLYKANTISIIDSLREGMTSGECYEFMLAMIKTMDILSRKR